MIERAGIDFVDLPDEVFDEPLGISTGAGVIFGATGGVMETARTAAEWITGGGAAPLEFKEVRGIADQGSDLPCRRSGAQRRRRLRSQERQEVLESVKRGEKNYQFIEIMCCPGGCVNDAAASRSSPPPSATMWTSARCAPRRYGEDEAKTLRKSHDNPVLKEVYKTLPRKAGQREGPPPPPHALCSEEPLPWANKKTKTGRKRPPILISQNMPSDCFDRRTVMASGGTSRKPCLFFNIF